MRSHEGLQSNVRYRSDARLVPTGLAALAAGVTSATIRKWASRGKITRFGTPQRAMYDINELMHLVGGVDVDSPD
jgi:hypothetical protein